MKICSKCEKSKKDYQFNKKGGDICENCRRKCEHNRPKNRCKDCGTGRCEHGRQKSICKDCGTGYCEHGNRKTKCKDCGTGLCEHNRPKYRCKNCGTGHCEHSKRKDNCKDCGKSYCIHNIQKYTCKECNGNGICEHNIIKQSCKICDLPSYLRGLINDRIRKSINNKDKKTIEYLGCSMEECKEHLEKQFKKDMNWANVGSLWHIDHIIPIKYRNDGIIPTMEEQIKRLYYKNTQPLYAIDNLKKGNRFIG